nr:PREDICTED: uncharacterized protein LOC109033408 isoform X3 [Bemisia tabaci]XP_018901554.1 PREDICTED: uncharacterized protein LOC109033408 isoform X3 [Bemisia tabaci]
MKPCTYNLSCPEMDSVKNGNLGAMIDAHPSSAHAPETPLSKDDYGELRKTGKPVVDKSFFIKLVLHERVPVVLITRPRRFGKSVNLSMLRHFLDFTENSTALFQPGSEIARSKIFCVNLQNRWPVVHVDLTDRDSTTFVQALNRVRSTMSRLYKDFTFLLKVLDPTETQQFNTILAGNGTESETAFAIVDLMENLKDRCKSKVMLLIDGYDSPLVQAFQYGYYDQMAYFLKTALNTAFRAEEVMQKAVIMGMLPIAKDILMEGLQQKYVTYPFSSYDSYFGYFGFLENEVEDLISRYKYSPKLFSEMSERYRGYFGGEEILYNPYSVIHTLEKKGLVNDYWIATGVTAKALSDVFETRGVIPMIQTKLLLEGIPLHFVFDFELSMAGARYSLDSFWTLVVHHGFLVLDHAESSVKEGKISYGLKVPNEEVKTALRSAVAGYFQRRPLPKYEVFVESVKNRSYARIQECLQSYMNVSGRFFRFDKLQGFEEFFMKLLAGLSRDYKSISTELDGDTLTFKLGESETLDALVFSVNYKSKDEIKESLAKKILVKVCHFVRRKKVPEKMELYSCHGSYFMTLDVQKTDENAT